MTKQYTDEQVAKLVEEVGDVLSFLNEGGTIGQFTGYTHVLNEAYEPFRPDPEKELRRALSEIVFVEGHTMDQIIAAVREHDAKYGAKG